MVLRYCIDVHWFEIIYEADISDRRQGIGWMTGDSLLKTNCIIEKTVLLANDTKCFR